MKVEGRCHCGRIRYEAVVDPATVGLCHCTDCQKLTGSPYRVSVAARPENIRMTGNPPKVYLKVAESGRTRRQYFCPECGSPVFVCGEDPETTPWGIRWGSINQRGELVPKRQIWCRSAQPWAARAFEDLPSAERD